MTGYLVGSKAADVPAPEGKPTDDPSGYYSYSYVHYPVVGEVDVWKIRQALYDRLYRPGLTGWSVGGYTTPGEVTDNGDGTVTVQFVYHHGD